MSPILDVDIIHRGTTRGMTVFPVRLRDGRALVIAQASPREYSILSQIGETDLSNAQIALKLGLTENTVAWHLSRIYRAFGFPRHLGRRYLQRWYLQNRTGLRRPMKDGTPARSAPIELHPEHCDCDEPYCRAMRDQEAA